MTRQFNEKSTTDEVLAGVDLAGKRVLVTGVSAGIGIETARALVAHGAEVVGAVRDLEKAQAATDGVRAAGKGPFSLIELDLASLKSVRRAADGLLAKGEKFDLIIANAGIMACPFWHTTDRFEMQFGTNHLGHFVFVNRIVPLLRPGGRLVNLSSAGHRYSDVDLEDPNFERSEYVPYTAYGRSKTANILFAVEFDRRHRASGIRATAVHPGGIATELARHAHPGPGELQKRVDEINAEEVAAGRPGNFVLKSVPQGAATSVWAGVVAAADAVGGRYCEDCGVAEVVTGDNAGLLRGGVQAYAVDAERAKALWKKSEEMVGEVF